MINYRIDIVTEENSKGETIYCGVVVNNKTGEIVYVSHYYKDVERVLNRCSACGVFKPAV